MAAVLEEFLSEKISSKSLVLWLSCNNFVADATNEVLKDRSLRADFMPFFINYLRDQTSHLIYHGASSGASPAKTPASAQKFRRSSLQHQNSSQGSYPQDSKRKSTQHRLNRTQLFSPSPLESDPSGRNCSFKSQDSEGDSPVVSAEGNSWDIPGQFYMKTPHDDHKGRTKKISPFHKKDDQRTLGQFMKGDGFNSHQVKGRRRSDQHHAKENVSHRTPVNMKRRSGNKGSKMSYSDGSLKSKAKPFHQDQPAPDFVLNDSEDFPAFGTPSSSTNIPSRRITPTAVTSNRMVLTSRVKHQSLTSPAFSKSYQEEPSESSPSFKGLFQDSADANAASCTQETHSHTNRGLERERELLRLERIKQANTNDVACHPDSLSSPQKPQTPTKTSISSAAFSFPAEVVKVSKKEVTYQESIDRLSELYSECTKACLMPNLTIELYFLVHLLTAKGSLSSLEGVNKHSDQEDINYLFSIHNCVYFSVSVLQQLLWLLLFLDKNTLRLLAEVPHLSEFSPALKSQLDLHIDGSLARPFVVAIKSPVQAVPFLADTDNRRNFPSEGAFHSFKKQRDKFYELVREWMDHHNKPGWNMHAAMARRIRELVQHVVEVANCSHFSRLFSSQLTRMCQGDHLITDHKDEKEQGLLGNLKKTNPEKFKRLEERFFTPTSSCGPSPPPSFQGCQEFFKEFIVAADSFLFNQHLIDNFSSKILEINEMQFGISDPDGEAESNGVDNEVRSNFSSNLQAARVLAKFLGFFIFLPYQQGYVLPEVNQADVIALRNKVHPPIDILDKLRTAFRHHRLVLTVPWVVEYLSMMDPIAAQLEHFQALLTLLVQVYRKVSEKLSSEPTSYNMLLVLLVLGWLFEIPGLPASMYFLSFADDFVFDDSVKEQSISNTSLDHHLLVDQQSLYLCCPYLGDIRVLLTDASLGFGSKGTPVKKITPISAKSPTKPVIGVQQLQQDLEKNFFDNHSPSLKKTVDFVSSRLGSNCIKHIDAKLITASRETAMSLLEREIKTEEVGMLDEEWTSQMKRAVLCRVKAKGEQVAMETMKAAEDQAKEFILSRSREALMLLLPQETCDQVLEAAAHITNRLAMERATRWINTQIQAAIQQELNTGIDRAVRAAKKESIDKPKVTFPKKHDRDVAAPSVILQQYKDTLRYLLTRSTYHEVTLDELVHLVTGTQEVLHSRQDLTPLACQMIQQLSIDLVAAIAIFKPDLLHSTITAHCATHCTGKDRGHVRQDPVQSRERKGQFEMQSSSDELKSKNYPNYKPGKVFMDSSHDSLQEIHSDVRLGAELSPDNIYGHAVNGERTQMVSQISDSHQDNATQEDIGLTQDIAAEAEICHLEYEVSSFDTQFTHRTIQGTHEQAVSPGSPLNDDSSWIFSRCILKTGTYLNTSQARVTDSNNAGHLPHEMILTDQVDRQEGSGMFSCHHPCANRRRMCFLDIFIILWRNYFKCKVSTEVFLCAKNAFLIEQTINSKESWHSMMSTLHSFTLSKLIDVDKVVQCLIEFIKSQYVNVTESLAAEVWAMSQQLIQHGYKPTALTNEEVSETDMWLLMHVLMARCPEGDTLSHLRTSQLGFQ